MPKQCIRIRDLGHAGVRAALDRARRIRGVPNHESCLAGKTALLVFEPAASSAPLFAAAVRSLGGRVISATSADCPAETMADTARAGQADLLIVSARDRLRLTAESRLPVLNAGDEEGDPCRVLADLLLPLERGETFARTRVAWIGKASGLAASWIEASIFFPFELFMAVPPGPPDRALPDLAHFDRALEPASFDRTLELASFDRTLELALRAGARIFLTHDPRMAAQGAKYLCLNGVWSEAEAPLFPELAALAAPGALLLEGDADLNFNGLSPAPGADERRLALIGALLEWLIS